MPTCMALAGSGINAVDSSSVTALGRAARSALRTAAAFLDRSHFPGRFAPALRVSTAAVDRDLGFLACLR